LMKFKSMSRKYYCKLDLFGVIVYGNWQNLFYRLKKSWDSNLYNLEERCVFVVFLVYFRAVL